jgi:putative DNA primase/helicase
MFLVDKKLDDRVKLEAVELGNRNKARLKAWTMIANAKTDNHTYLESKGLDDMKGLVYDEKLIIPMYKRCEKGFENYLTGCQTIDEFGNKKFLFGQECSGAFFRIGTGSINILCEGFATGISIQKAAKSIEYSIYICFSAANIAKVARKLKSGVVVADHDKSGVGEKYAKETGFKYWLSDTVGEDFNDYWRSISAFKSEQTLKKLAFNMKI